MGSNDVQSGELIPGYTEGPPDLTEFNSLGGRNAESPDLDSLGGSNDEQPGKLIRGDVGLPPEFCDFNSPRGSNDSQ